MKRTFFILLLLLPMSLCAQKQGQKLIDSLLRKLHTMKEDTNKVITLNDLAALYASVNPDEGMKYGAQGIMLADKLNWEPGAALLNNSLGKNYMSKADYPQALSHFYKSLQSNKAVGNKAGAAVSLECIGAVMVSQGAYPNALQYYREALQLNQELDDKRGIATSLASIGNVYQNQSNDAQAMEYLTAAMKIDQELGDKAGIASNLNFSGVVYIDQGNFAQALENYSKALQIYEELHDKGGIARSLKNIGNGYMCLHNYTKALENYEKALKIHEELGDKSGIARNLGNIGNVYQEQDKYAMALAYLLKAYNMNDTLGEKYPKANNLGSIGTLYLDIAMDSSGNTGTDSLIPAGRTASLHKAVEYLSAAIALDKEIGNLHEVQFFSLKLSEALEALGDYKEALESYDQHTAARDSVFSVESALKIAALEEKLEAELKQKQIELQQLKITTSRHRNLILLIVLGMLAAGTGGLFLRFTRARKTRLALEEKNRLIAEETEKADMLRIRAERSEQFKQQFLGSMSHEIRTPMNSVSGMTNLLLHKSPRPDQVQYLQIISRSTDILVHIINDILDISKIEAGKLELENIDFSLGDTIRQVKETLSFRVEEKELQLITHIDDDVPEVLEGDPFRLNQVLINLGGNAIKFTEKGSVEISVSRVKNDGDKVLLRFSVADTGIGIPQDKLKSLFESFRQVQASDTRRYGGTGLGLSISRQLVELQGGAITVESVEGHGAVFSFELEYTDGSRQRLLEKNQQEREADGSVLNGLRILIVDDNEFNRLVASETLLSKADVSLDEAADGEQATMLMWVNDYDAVLMDIQMPVMDGLEATRYIRSTLPSPKNATPVVALTAALLHGDINKCMEAGMNAFVPKPFKPWQLITALANVTGRARP